MTDSTKIEQNLSMLMETLQMRFTALTLALEMNDSSLYAAAIANDDEAILASVEEMVAKQRVAVSDYAMQLAASESVDESDHIMFHLSTAQSGLATLIRLRDLANVGIGLKKSGMVCYPPSTMSTEEILDTIRRITSDEAEEV